MSREFKNHTSYPRPSLNLHTELIFLFLSRAHWYLAVICFPGLKGPIYEQNPLYQGPFPPPSSADLSSEENIPDHCRPLSPERDGLDSSSDDPVLGVPQAPLECRGDCDLTKENSAFTGRGETSNNPMTSQSRQTEPERQFTSEFILGLTILCSDRDKTDLFSVTFVLMSLFTFQTSCKKSVFITPQEKKMTPSASLMIRAPVTYVS